MSLDAQWPALRPAPLEILKLSVNGEELNAIRGARALLSRREVCSVLVHVTKAQRGWADDESKVPGRAVGEGAEAAVTGLAFSSELWELLSVTGGLEVSLHLDEDVTEQVRDDPRPRPSTRQLRSASDLNDVFAGQSFSHDYLIARQSPPQAPCVGSRALLHWNEVFG